MDIIIQTYISLCRIAFFFHIEGLIFHKLLLSTMKMKLYKSVLNVIIVYYLLLNKMLIFDKFVYYIFFISIHIRQLPELYIHQVLNLYPYPYWWSCAHMF